MDIDMVTVKVGPDPLAERLADGTAATHKRVHRDRSIVAEPEAVQLTTVEAREVERGLPHRLARNSRIGYRTPETRATLDERDLLAEIGGLSGALLAAWARADHDEIVRPRFHVRFFFPAFTFRLVAPETVHPVTLCPEPGHCRRAHFQPGSR